MNREKEALYKEALEQGGLVSMDFAELELRIAALQIHDESGDLQQEQYDALANMPPRERIVKVWSTPTEKEASDLFQAHATLEAEEIADMPEHLVAATRRTRPLEQFGCVVTSTPTSALGNRLQRQAVPLTEKEASDLFLDSTQQVTIK